MHGSLGKPFTWSHLMLHIRKTTSLSEMKRASLLHRPSNVKTGKIAFKYFFPVPVKEATPTFITKSTYGKKTELAPHLKEFYIYNRKY